MHVLWPAHLAPAMTVRTVQHGPDWTLSQFVAQILQEELQAVSFHGWQQKKDACARSGFHRWRLRPVFHVTRWSLQSHQSDLPFLERMAHARSRSSQASCMVIMCPARIACHKPAHLCRVSREAFSAGLWAPSTGRFALRMHASNSSASLPCSPPPPSFLDRWLAVRVLASQSSDCTHVVRQARVARVVV